jgi:hypothetical protein
MNVAQLSNEQRTLAVQRLTALWAFIESGLGGALHALKVPFTGLVVGGIAVLIITLIGYFSNGRFKQIFQSLVIVLVVKAAVSPHTPFPAYIAVSFQAVIGFVLFSLLNINLISILLLSVVAMIESAIQKLLLLTLFFGKSFWNAADELMNFITKQLSVPGINGSLWIITSYLSVYIIGGIITALMTYKVIKEFTIRRDRLLLPYISISDIVSATNHTVNRRKRVLLISATLVLVSTILYVFAADTQQASFAVIKTIIWTVSAVTVWYLVITPLVINIFSILLKKKQHKYSEQIGATIAFLPVLKQLTTHAWKASATHKGSQRLSLFLTTLINWSLTYTDTEASNSSV